MASAYDSVVEEIRTRLEGLYKGMGMTVGPQDPTFNKLPVRAIDTLLISNCAPTETPSKWTANVTFELCRENRFHGKSPKQRKCLRPSRQNQCSICEEL
jgi:hypothetical protein